MNRTVLLSEVHEVAGRFPASIAEFRERLAHAGLLQFEDQALGALAERIVADVCFREEMHAAVSALCDAEPSLSQLELLGILVVAAVGSEQAAVLAAFPDAEAPASTLFNFLLESRRRRRDSAVDMPRPTLERMPVEAQPEAELELERFHAVQIREERFADVRSEARPLVTASPAGNSSMLARALAMAADERLAAAAQRESRDFMEDAVFARVADEGASPERVRPHREMFVPGAMVREEFTDLEEPEEPARRWGMWTAATCGVLLGFGFGVFLHVDHRTAPVVARAAASRETPTVGNSAPGKGKSINELQAEIAALDSVASVSPLDEPAQVIQKQTLPAPLGVRSQRAHREVTGGSRSRAIVGPERGLVGRGRMWETKRESSRRAVGPVSAPASSVSGRTPTLIAAGGPASLNGTAVASDGLPHASGTIPLPRVITGSAGMMAANLVSSPAPAYPAAASAAGVQGEVVVEAVVGRDGDVKGTRVVSGPLLLRAAALDAVQRWRYRPYEVDGKATEVATTARLEFRLEQ